MPSDILQGLDISSKRQLTREERDYIEANYLQRCSSKDSTFRKMIAEMVLSFGYGTQEEAKRTEIETARRILEYEQSMAPIVGGSASETIIPAKYRNRPYDASYWPELSAAISSVASANRIGFEIHDLYIHGPSHTGKSHGAAVIAERCIEQGKKALWVNCPRLRNLYEDGITDRQAKQKAIWIKSEAIEAPVLILDDVGKDETTSQSGDRRTLSFFGRALYEIVEERQGKTGKLTIYTSEFGPDEDILSQRLTQAVVNRIADKAQVVGDAPQVPYRIWLEHKKSFSTPDLMPLPSAAI